VRTGPSLWLPEHGILVDTPEESNQQLNRLGPVKVNGILWTHFHPDHTAGCRVAEFIARWGEPGVPTWLAADLESSLERVSLWRFQRDTGHLAVRRVEDGVPFRVGSLTVTPLRHLGEPPIFSYLIEDGNSRLLYCGDHLVSLPFEELTDLDAAIVQVGLMPEGVQEVPLASDHPARKALIPIDTIAHQAHNLAWRRLVFTHLYEGIRMHPDEYEALGERLSRDHDLRVQFAWDGMELD
jgi:phosphoribosyl 1,2-cyclic phosphate phosphodiesterase